MRIPRICFPAPLLARSGLDAAKGDRRAAGRPEGEEEALAITGTGSGRSLAGPFHGVLLAGTIPLFLGALLSDWAYARSYQVQWTNFASWLIAGGLVYVGLALAWAFVAALRADAARRRRAWALVLLLALTFLLGLANALVHARDAWAAMPDGLILSAVVLLLAVATLWLGLSSRERGEQA